MCPLFDGSDSGREQSSIESLHNCAVDREARAPEGASAWTRDQTILDECQDLKFFTHLTS
jgi:hypothetical protein